MVVVGGAAMSQQPGIYENKTAAARGALGGIAGGTVCFALIIGGIRGAAWLVEAGVHPAGLLFGLAALPLGSLLWIQKQDRLEKRIVAVVCWALGAAAVIPQ